MNPSNLPRVYLLVSILFTVSLFLVAEIGFIQLFINPQTLLIKSLITRMDYLEARLP